MIDGNINLDEIVKLGELAAAVVSAGWFIWRISKIMTRIETSLVSQSNDIAALQMDVRIVSQLVTDIAVQKNRLDSMDRRFDTVDRHYDSLDRRYDELTRGIGFKSREINGEYTNQGKVGV